MRINVEFAAYKVQFFKSSYRYKSPDISIPISSHSQRKKQQILKIFKI